jgi:MarR family protein
VPQTGPARIAFLTNHAQVLLCISDDPGVRLREIGALVGITERAAHRIVGELEASGYVARRRNGRRNHYTVNAHVPLPDPLAREQRVGDLLETLSPTKAARSSA